METDALGFLWDTPKLVGTDWLRTRVSTKRDRVGEDSNGSQDGRTRPGR